MRRPRAAAPKCCPAPTCCCPAPCCAPKCCEAPHCCAPAPCCCSEVLPGPDLRLPGPVLCSEAAARLRPAAGPVLCSEVLRGPALLCAGPVLCSEVLPGPDLRLPDPVLCLLRGPALLCRPRAALRSAARPRPAAARAPEVLRGPALLCAGPVLCSEVLPGPDLRLPGSELLQQRLPDRNCCGHPGLLASLFGGHAKGVCYETHCTTVKVCCANPCEVAELIYASQTACYGRQRAHAIHKLGAFDCQCNPEILCAMVYALNDADEHVRREAAEADRRVAPPQSLLLQPRSRGRLHLRLG